MLVIMLVIIALSTLTASLFKNSKPEMRTIPFPGLLLIFIVSSSMPENCSVAPRRESIREPSRPAAKHKGITRGLVTRSNPAKEDILFVAVSLSPSWSESGTVLY